MDNVFITQFFDWNRPPSWKARTVNGALARLGIEARLFAPRQTGEQTTVEQRINMYHLASQVLAYGVPGALVEIGTLQGSSAALLAKVIEQFDSSRELHVYDAFAGGGPNELLANFERLKLRPPTVHAGWFRDTLPSQLPESVCFAHVDIGWGQPPEAMVQSAQLALSSVYPRMPRGAILLVADYCEPDMYERQGFEFPHAITNQSLWNMYPALKKACDGFFANKPEKMLALYSGHYSHGYFRKL
jgi:O-methyltransferase